MMRHALNRGLLALLVLAVTVPMPLAHAAKNKKNADTPPPDEIVIPVCAQKIGTLAVTEPDDHWWRAYELESPEALIKVFVDQSKCFTLLDRGKGLTAAQQERALSSSGEMRGGSNVGKGQMKAADYVLVPDLVTKNRDSGGKRSAAVGRHLGQHRRRRAGRHESQEQRRRRRAHADRRALDRAGGARAGPCQEDRPGLGRWRWRVLRGFRGGGREQLCEYRHRPGRDDGVPRRLHEAASTKIQAMSLSDASGQNASQAVDDDQAGAHVFEARHKIERRSGISTPE